MQICWQAYEDIISLRILLSTIVCFPDMKEKTSPENNLFYSLGHIPLNIFNTAFSMQERTVKYIRVINEFLSGHLLFF